MVSTSDCGTGGPGSIPLASPTYSLTINARYDNVIEYKSVQIARRNSAVGKLTSLGWSTVATGGSNPLQSN